MHSAEDQLGVFAQLYSLPWLSLRSVLWEQQQRGAKGYSMEEVMLPGGNDMHPSPYGHKYIPASNRTLYHPTHPRLVCQLIRHRSHRLTSRESGQT